MKVTHPEKLKPKKVIVFDLDGTLIRTKSPVDREMATLFSQLLATKKVAIIGGGKYAVFQDLFLRKLTDRGVLLDNLFLFPTTAAAFYKHHHGWQQVYTHPLTKLQRVKIKQTFEKVFAEIGYKEPKKTYGKLIEDRKTEVTFSVFGQDAVTVLGRKGVLLKEQWGRKHIKTKMRIVTLMQKYLPNLAVHAAGFTSIDVTKKGADKAYGIRQIQKYVRVKIKDMVFVGDAIFPGGNDYAVVKTGVDYVSVANIEATKKVIRALLSKAR